MAKAATASRPRTRAVRQDIESYRTATRAGRAGAHHYARLLGLRLSSPLEVMNLLSRGLRFESVERFLENSRFSTEDFAALVAIPARTLARRKEQGRLDPAESDRLLRVTRVFARALDLFEGDADAAHRWFGTPARALGGQRPKTLARTDLGSREVENLIDRLEHGVLT